MKYYSEETVKALLENVSLHTLDDCPSIEIPNPWHTGTPTEEGWYLLQFKDDNTDEIRFDTIKLTKERIEHLNALAWFVHPWQKIEPYKEAST